LLVLLSLFLRRENETPTLQAWKMPFFQYITYKAAMHTWYWMNSLFVQACTTITIQNILMPFLGLPRTHKVKTFTTTLPPRKLNSMIDRAVLQSSHENLMYGIPDVLYPVYSSFESL